MKKFLFILFVFIISCFSFFAVNNDAKASTSDAYLIMTNPAEDSNSSIIITWHTLIEGTFVEYTIKEDADFTMAKRVDGIYEELTIYNGTTDSNVTDYKCHVILENLLSDTEYIYRVGKNSMSSVHTFKTGGSENFNFAVISDIHVYSKIASRLSKAESIVDDMNSNNKLSFVMSIGDTTAYGTHRGYWNDLCDSSIIENYMFASTPGNHDYYNSSATFLDSSYYNAYTMNPNNGPKGMENTTYYFYYNNILFISLNSEDGCTNSSKRQLQRDWLDDVLASNTANFIIVYFHRSMYPGSGNNNGHASTMKNAYQDLFDKYGVDIVFGGHDHVYVRTNKIINGSTSNSSLFGTTYISLPQIGDRSVAENNDYTDISKKFGSISGGLLFKATKDSLSFSLYNDNGEVLDSGVIVSKMSLLEQKKVDRNTKIIYEDIFSNMKLYIYEGLFQRAINIKVYEGEDVILDFRPEYNKTVYEISSVSDVDMKKEYRIIISYRDGTNYQIDTTVKNEELDISYSHDDINCFIDEEIVLAVKNNLNLDLDYSYQIDEEYIIIEDGKMYAKKNGKTFINVYVGDEKVLEIEVNINENIKYYATLNLNGGTYKENEAKVLIENINQIQPIREGYTFAGWYLDPQFTESFEDVKYNKDIMVYAKWIENESVKEGCNSASVFHYSLLLLGLFLLKRKRY